MRVKIVDICLVFMPQLKNFFVDRIMFFYSLAILFNDIRVIRPAEGLLIVCAILILLYISVPISERAVPYYRADNFLLVSWLGGIPLYQVFWPFFLVLNIALFTADWLSKTAVITVSTWDEIHFALLLMIIWWATSVWRCSVNSQSRLLAALARLMVLSVLFEYGLKLWIRIDYPRIFFNCQDALLDYASCF